MPSMPAITRQLVAEGILIVVVFHALLLSAAGMVWVERRLAAALQQRLGPIRVGWQGLLQPFADVIKLMFKEELRPKAADWILFAVAPIISAACAFSAFAVVPFGAQTTFFGLLKEPLKLQVADVNVAVLVIFAIASMSVYGMVLASVLIVGNSLSLTDIVNGQGGYWFGFIPKWFVFVQPLGFLIYLTAGIAETNRAPFDFPEAEQ